MRAVCPTDSGPDIFVEFPAGSSDSDLWRYGCRRAEANDQPTDQDFVATGIVNLDTPTATEPSGPPRFAEPNPPSFVFDAVETTSPVVTAPRFTPRMAEPNPPTWFADLEDVVATTVAAVVDLVRPAPRIPPAPVVLEIPQPFTDSGITQTPRDFVPSIFTAPTIVPTAPAPRMAEPNPPSWISDIGDVVATTVAAIVDVVRPAPRIAEPNPPTFTAQAPAPAPAPVNRPRPASLGPVCLRLPGGGYTSVPPEYRNGYDGEEVEYAYCLGKTDTEPVVLGPGGGSNPIQPPPTDPTPPTDPITQIFETFIPTGIVNTILDPVINFLRTPAPYQAVAFTPTGIVTAPAGDVSVDKMTSGTATATACSCNDNPSGENRNWMLLLGGALLVYLLTHSKK